MSANNGGPAFPLIPPVDATGDSAVGYPYPHEGMTLRDYFAAKAMQGLLAQSCGSAAGSDPKWGAEYAYLMADAMIAARETK